MFEQADQVPAGQQPVPSAAAALLDTEQLNTMIDASNEPLLAISRHYPAGHRNPEHSHSRVQIWCCQRGVVVVSIGSMRWLVPAGHGLIIPANLRHSAEALSDVHMHSIYVAQDVAAIELHQGMPRVAPRVVAITRLADCLVSALIAQPDLSAHRQALIMALLLDEVGQLPHLPLGLPFPADPRLAALCRNFLAAPSARTSIDDWAGIAGLSRRSFTRLFRAQTGISFVTWRQQACIVAALPSLASGRSVTEVAFDAGYDSIAAFTTMFRRMLGTAPSQYIRALTPPQV